MIAKIQHLLQEDVTFFKQMVSMLGWKETRGAFDRVKFFQTEPNENNS
jgi:hypothetical protein